MIETYDANELTSAVNKIVEDINRRFTIEVLYRVDKAEVTENLRKLLKIKNKPELSVNITEAHKAEIKQYLDRLYKVLFIFFIIIIFIKIVFEVIIKMIKSKLLKLIIG